MAYSIEINSVAKNWQVETLSVNMVANNRWTMDVEINSYDGSFRAPLGGTIVLKKDGTPVFGGIIDAPRETAFGTDIRGPAITNHITATDFKVLTDRRVMYGATVPAGTLKAALQYVVNNYLNPDHGITLDAGQVNGPDLDSIPLDFFTTGAYLDGLSEMTDYIWEIDASKVLRMFLPSAVNNPAPYNVATGDGHVIGDIEIEIDDIDYANYVLGRYMEAAAPAYAFWELFSGNAADGDEVSIGARTYTFQTSLDNSKQNNVLIGANYAASRDNLMAAINGGGGESTVYSTGTEANSEVTATLNFARMKVTAIEAGARGNSITVASTCAGGFWYGEGTVPTDVLKLGHDDQMTELVTSSDSGEITARGRYDYVLEMEKIFVGADAQAAADAARDEMKIIRHVASFASFDSGWKPGQVLTINVPQRNVNAPFLITEVQILNNESEQIVYIIKAYEGTTFQGSWQDIYKLWAGGAGGSSRTGSFTGSVVSGGGGGGGTVLGTGTVNVFSMWTAGNTIGNSIMSQTGTTVLVAGTLQATTLVGAISLPDASITLVKLENIAQDTVLGRSAAGSGPVSALTTLPTAVLPVVPLAKGGTNANLSAVQGGVVYSGASALAISAAGNSGQLLRSAGTGAPAWTTATYPSASPGAGRYLRGDGTNWVTSTLVLPNAATANRIVYATSSNTWGEHASLTFDGSLFTVATAASFASISSHLKPTTTDLYDLGSYDKLWANGFISTLNAIVFKESTATIFGGYSIVGPQAGSFSADVASGATTINFGQTMTVGHWVLVRAHATDGNVKAEYLLVGSLVSGTTYNVTRDLAAAHSPDPAWASGTPFLVLGAADAGRIEMLAYDGKPRITFVQQGAAYNLQIVRSVLGNLNGYYGYATDLYGAGIGSETGANIVIDPTNGIRLRYGTTDKITLSAAGAANFTGTVTAADGNIAGWLLTSGYIYSGSTSGSRVGLHASDTGTDVAIYAGNSNETLANFRVLHNGDMYCASATIENGVIKSGATAFGTGTGYWLAYNAGSPQFRVGDPAGDRLSWSSGTLYVRSGKLLIDGTNSGHIGMGAAPYSTATLNLASDGNTSATISLLCSSANGSNVSLVCYGDGSIYLGALWYIMTTSAGWSWYDPNTSLQWNNAGLTAIGPFGGTVKPGFLRVYIYSHNGYYERGWIPVYLG